MLHGIDNEETEKLSAPADRPPTRRNRPLVQEDDQGLDDEDEDFEDEFGDGD